MGLYQLSYRNMLKIADNVFKLIFTIALPLQENILLPSLGVEPWTFGLWQLDSTIELMEHVGNKSFLQDLIAIYIYVLLNMDSGI